MIIEYNWLVYCSPETVIKVSGTWLKFWFQCSHLWAKWVLTFHVSLIWFRFSGLSYTVHLSIIGCSSPSPCSYWDFSWHRLQGPNTLSPKAVCIRTLTKNIHVLQVLDSISGPETSIPGWQRTGPKTHSVGQNDRPDGPFYGGKTTVFRCTWAANAFSLVKFHWTPICGKFCVNAAKLLRRTGAPSAGHGILWKTPKAKKKQESSGTLW